MTMPRRLVAALRTIAALPEDDWQPADHDSFEAARDVVAEYLAVADRKAGVPCPT